MIQFKTLRTIYFSELYLWDVKRFLKSKMTSEHPSVALKKLIKQRKQKVKLFDFPEKEFGILGISKKKGMFDAYTKKGKLFKQSYQKVQKRDLAYNPWNINDGSIGLKTENQKNDWISSAYVVFECLQDLNPEFLLRILKTNSVKEIISNMTTGSIRPTFNYNLFENLKIPLPSIEEQNRLVQNYNTKIVLAEQQDQQVQQLEQEMEDYLFDALGIERRQENKTQKGLQFIHYKHLTDWYFHKNQTQFNNSNKFSLTSILLLDGSSIFRGKTPKYDKTGFARILNQKCNRWNSLKLKYSKKVNDHWASAVDKKFFTREGDILINSLGEGTIGRSTFITQQNEGLLFDSCMILLRLDQKRVNPKFFSYLFNSRYGQNQVEDLKSARSTNQTSLCVKNLKKMMFPLPTKVIQNKIANHISRLRVQIQEFKKQAKHNREKAIIELEKEIFNIA